MNNKIEFKHLSLPLKIAAIGAIAYFFVMVGAMIEAAIIVYQQID